MQRSLQKLFTLLIGVPALLVIIACTGMLVTDYVRVYRRTPIDKQRIETLKQIARQEASYLPQLTAEFEKQTEALLARAASNEVNTNILIIASVLFLVCAKWSIALGEGGGRRFDNITNLRSGRLMESSRSVVGNRKSSLTKKACASDGHLAIDLSLVDDVITQHGRGSEAVIPILQGIQGHYHYLPDSVLQRLCELTEITPAQITGVASFFKQFRRTPVGKHIIKVCHGTACHVSGAQHITDEIRRYLGIAADRDTDGQGLFTIEEVACLGCCTLAPVVQIDTVTYGHLTADKVPQMLNEHLAAASSGVDRRRRRLGTMVSGADGNCGEIRIGLGSCCVAGGSGRVYEALEQAVSAVGSPATVKRVGCVGMCHRTPLVEMILPGKPTSLYAGVDAESAKSIVRRHIKPQGLTRRLSNSITTALERVLHDKGGHPLDSLSIAKHDTPVYAFLGRQKHITTEHCGDIDPTDIDEYLQLDGFKAFTDCIKGLTPQQVIEVIERSQLRGRGGAGYSVGLKWSKVQSAGGSDKYIICNGDEGDPGAFMDRMLMESYPYRIIEGLAIAAYAVGAHEGYFYIRAEYPIAVQRMGQALEQCENRGFLGDDILGTGFKLRLRIMEGAGAFVCGEETALLASIEGRRGSPRLRPPYPAEKGLRGKPTLVSNVETYATVPWIMRNGAEAFTALGTATSRGTKVFALAGKVERGGLIEVPMGITIGEIVEAIGGGVKNGQQFKAVQIGGPSGGCIPATASETPVDYEALTEVGAMMGSGGLVVLDETDCMVDMARYFLAFSQDQSCGKCTYCRIGTHRMLDIMNRLCAGQGKQDDLEKLESLAGMIKEGSLCGLGKNAPNPVLTTLRYFRDEYQAHLQGRCPAGKCKALITYSVTDDCTGCTLCAQHCPAEAIAFTPYQQHEIDADKCTRCDICRIKCPEDAIKVE
ncbi:MAG: NAD(P)H-dependent oxidoreductase subunit E [Planctomycetota bacterium]|jgi:NADH-quinone oxidoreductase subunit F